jgi:hypothetical protein
MVENGANPEALAAVVKEMRKESFSLSNSEIFVIYANLEKVIFFNIYIIIKLYLIMKNNKDKKQRKKFHKRKVSDDNFNSNEEDNKIEVEPYIEVKKITTLIDTKISSCFEIIGYKGHINYYTKQNLELGIYYFEVIPINMDFNITEYISNKRTDEFSKKYYESILYNIKDYIPNIRIGFINSKGDSELPLGAEVFSYGYRVSDGCLINDGEYMKNDYNYLNNTMIGALINLRPPRPDFLKNSEKKDINNECYIKFFVNGVEMEKKFIGIHEGSYKAAITLYNFSKANINLGPNYQYKNFDEYNYLKNFNELN